MSRRDPQGLGYDPNVLRRLLDIYTRIGQMLNELRRDSTDVEELLSIAWLTDEMAAKRASAQRRLDRIETHRDTEAGHARYMQTDQFNARMAACEAET